MSKRPDWSPDPVIDWLQTEGRYIDDIKAIARGAGDALRDVGAPISRFRLSLRTLHPLITAVSGIWERDQVQVDDITASHGLEQRPSYVGSPMAYMSETNKPFRKRLTEELGDKDHLILHELKATGATDYYGYRMRFRNGRGSVAVYNTDRPDGFTDADIRKFDVIGKTLGLVLEIYETNRTSLAVAEAYLGPRTGRRVLEGRITRDDVRTMDAAILVSDVRDWTGLSGQLPVHEMLAIANRYFDIMADAIEGHGGEILKFIGDSVLAIFEVDDGNIDDACVNAHAAARQALAKNATDRSLPLDFGIGLHVGEVLYGNIGSEKRIDFTVLGQPVNAAVRIEGLCRPLGYPLLYSADVARHLATTSRKVAARELKGHDGAFDLYTDTG